MDDFSIWGHWHAKENWMTFFFFCLFRFVYLLSLLILSIFNENRWINWVWVKFSTSLMVAFITTNNKGALHKAMLWSGLMNVHVVMGCCEFEDFKTIASNYLSTCEQQINIINGDRWCRGYLLYKPLMKIHTNV